MVQSELAQEKMQAAAKEQAAVDDLKKTSDKFKKEADVAEEIAKEKAEAAVKSEKEEKVAEAKVGDLQAESHETQKFLLQTKREEAGLEAQVEKYKKMKDELLTKEVTEKK